MKKTLHHQEGDRVPISDFFWGSFLKRWREELGLAPDTDIYRYYDLDWMNFNPNLDPHIKPFEILHEDAGRCGAHRIRSGHPQAAGSSHAGVPGVDTNTIEKMEAFQFDDPWDERRYFRAGDDQINGVGDGFAAIPRLRRRSREPTPIFPFLAECWERMRC